MYLCYGVDVVHLLTRRRYCGNTRLLILIRRNKAEATKQLVCVSAGRDAGRIWTGKDAQIQACADDDGFLMKIEITLRFLIKPKCIIYYCNHYTLIS